MFKNTLKIAWRSLLKDRQFTILNLAGLASGLAFTFLIYLWVSNEWSIDKFHKNGQQIYQVIKHLPHANDKVTEHTPDLLARSLADEMPEVEEAAIVKSPDEDDNPKGILSANNASIKAAELFITPNFFNIFSFHLIQGNKQQIFPGNNSVLLSVNTAIKLFHGTQNVIGKIITWNRGTGDSKKYNGVYQVSGIFEDPPANSSMKFDILFPHQLYAEKNAENISWGSSDPATYVVLKKGTDINLFNRKIRNLIKSKFTPGSEDQNFSGTLFIQRYTERYLHNRYENGVVAGGRIEYVRLFSIIAVLILIIACINFMNLSTAKASGRMKEIGIKKVIGANRSMLFIQYISESILMTFIALILAVGLVWVLLPAFKEIVGKNLDFHLDISLILFVAGVTLITGIISGSYPALYMSGFKPIMALKGKLTTTSGESMVRKALVVFQFAISIVFILSVIVVYKQMNLIQTKNLGYNKDNIIRFSNDGRLQQNTQAFLADIKQIPDVVNASDMEGDMFGNHSGGGGIEWPEKTNKIQFSGLYADYDFMETMGLKTTEGRSFSRNYATDTSGVLFNETAIKEMGLKNPIGQTVKLWGRPQIIIGVIKDFHFESIYKKISPFFLSYRKNTSNIVVKIKAGTEKKTISRLEKLYKQYNSGLPFEYKFMDDDYQALYASEERVAELSKYFAAIAILISCLGLFGLAAFTSQRRQKEIGIRKVVGASIVQMIFLLSKDFLNLIIFSSLIAFPIAWWGMNHWLGAFSYRVSLSFDMFALTFILMLIITLITVSYQAIKAALVNPIKSLRTE